MKTIELGGKVMVSDPCYGMNVWCHGIVENVLPGTYNCSVVYSNEGAWGVRVAEIEVLHQDAKRYTMSHSGFVVGVDSGQAGIFDYEYYEHYHQRGVDDDWYDRVCAITLSAESAGTIDDSGFVSMSGFGDGGYDCYLYKDLNYNVVGFRIVYIYEDEEED